jgi:SAM-dependent methyltransferase
MNERGLCRRLVTRRSLAALLDRLDFAARRTYDALCGTHPNIHSWHFQWLATRELHRNLRPLLAEIRGRVLDVGCGRKPYAAWMTLVGRHEIVGLDVTPGQEVDVTVAESGKWPFRDGMFDAVLCTQVLEHSVDPEGTMEEIHRVLAAGGTLILTVPFLAHEHGAPRDFRRYSVQEVVRLLSERYAIMKSKKVGAFGSTATTIALSWLWTSWDRRAAMRAVKFPLLPVWMACTVLLNVAGLALDAMDATGAYYGNVLVVARKRTDTGCKVCPR